jgi:hypothetical protein
VARAGREGAQGEAAGIELACARAARTAYGWGSLYAALRVERWSPPERAARA